MSKLLQSLRTETIDHFGEKEGGEFFDEFIKPVILLKSEMRLIKLDLDHFSDTFTKIIIPETRKFNRNLSKLKDELFHSMTESSKNNEILSLAYMGLYHKIENYENRILWNYNSNTDSNKKTIEEIGITIDSQNLFKERNRIRLICNSIKHNDCFPKKGLLEYYQNLDLNKKFDLTQLNFMDDIKLIKEFIKTFNILILCKIVEHSIDQIQNIDDIELLTISNNFKEILSKYINHLNINGKI